MAILTGDSSERNRVTTIQRIKNAFQEILREDGLQKLTLTKLALKTNLSATIIRRYFGSLRQLLIDYIRSGHLYPVNASQLAMAAKFAYKPGYSTPWLNQTIYLYRQLRVNKASRQILCGQVSHPSLITKAIYKVQDEELRQVIKNFAPLKEGDDAEAIALVLLAGMQHLTMLAHLGRPMVSIDLQSEAGWLRIEKALELVYIGLQKDSNSPKK